MPAPQGEAPICENHKVPMVWKEGKSQKTGRDYAFYGCNLKMQDGSWCTYKSPRPPSEEMNAIREVYKLLLEIKNILKPAPKTTKEVEYTYIPY